MSRYVFLGSILPPLHTERSPEWLFDDVINLLYENLSKTDALKVSRLRMYIDLKNIESFFHHQNIDHRGMFSEKNLEDSLAHQDGWPDYVLEYVLNYDQLSQHQKIEGYSRVISTYFNKIAKEETGFLKWYASFERELRILLVGYRSRLLQVDPSVYLQHEDLDDSIVAYVLAQKDAVNFEFPAEYQDLQERLKQLENHPYDQYMVMAYYRFSKINEKIQDKPFSMDYILGYFVQFMIVEDLHSLDNDKGGQLLNEMVKEVI